MTLTEFRPIFDAVCDDYGMDAEARATAWESCLGGSDGSTYLLRHAEDCYVAVARTKGPWLPCGSCD